VVCSRGTSSGVSRSDGYTAAYDELAKGRSTFMVEMSETSDILKTCTSRSLVILDERRSLALILLAEF